MVYVLLATVHHFHPLANPFQFVSSCLSCGFMISMAPRVHGWRVESELMRFDLIEKVYQPTAEILKNNFRLLIFSEFMVPKHHRTTLFGRVQTIMIPGTVIHHWNESMWYMRTHLKSLGKGIPHEIKVKWNISAKTIYLFMCESCPSKLGQEKPIVLWK
jgi:hypothetical protein